MIKWLLKLFERETLEKLGSISAKEIKGLFEGKVIRLGFKIYTIDDQYSLTNVSNIRKFLLKDFLSFKRYRPEIFDCDDFAIQLWAKFKKLYPKFAFGFAISSTHAFNVFIDEKKKLWVIEPQTDEVMDYKTVKNKYKIRMVII